MCVGVGVWNQNGISAKFPTDSFIHCRNRHTFCVIHFRTTFVSLCHLHRQIDQIQENVNKNVHQKHWARRARAIERQAESEIHWDTYKLISYGFFAASDTISWILPPEYTCYYSEHISFSLSTLLLMLNGKMVSCAFFFSCNNGSAPTFSHSFFLPWQEMHRIHYIQCARFPICFLLQRNKIRISRVMSI